jgi:prohibitin 2
VTKNYSSDLKMSAKRPPGPDFGNVTAAIRRSLGRFGSVAPLFVGVTFTGIAGWTLYNSIYFVQGGFRAVKFNAITGLYEGTFGEGANLAIPFLETPVIFDIRNKPAEVITSSGSRDLQMINMAVRVLFQPNVEGLHHIYRNLGVNYAETVLPSLVNEIIKSVIAQFNAADLLQKRPEVSQRIAVTLAERAKRFHIDITDVSITQMSFGKEYASAVESKQIAHQNAERAKFRVEQAEQEKLSMILLAQGEAQSAKLIGDALNNNPAFLELRKIEAARTISKTVGSKGRGQYYLDSDTLLTSVASQAGKPSSDASVAHSSKKMW